VPKLPRDGGRLRKLALSYPEAHEDMPWGHHAIKVKGKSFVFLAADEETFSLSAKLPSSAGVAVKLPFASPTEYGLGKSGWVTARFPRSAKIRSSCSSSGSTRAIARLHPGSSLPSYPTSEDDASSARSRRTGFRHEPAPGSGECGRFQV